MRTGIDAASYQTGLTYTALADGGVTFAYIKLTQGNTYYDPMAVTHVKGCEAAGIAWGGYHFFVPTINPATQAALFVSHLASIDGTPSLPPAVDVEVEDPLGWAHLASVTVEFCRTVEGQTGHPTSTYYTNDTFARSLPGWPFTRYPWLADPTDTAPTLPRIIRQLAPRPMQGSPADIDVDLFVGTTAQWATFCHAATPVPPTPPAPPAPPVPPQEVTVQVPQCSTVSALPGPTRSIQTLLTDKWGISTNGIDGSYGAHTQSAVEVFQRNHGLAVDGICGPATWTALVND